MQRSDIELCTHSQRKALRNPKTEERPELTQLVPRSLIDEAVKFHGHLGVFLILGLKAGLYANEVLGKDHFRTRAIVESELFPPFSCFVDGVQVTTGCTMGKGNIELKNGHNLSVTFVRGSKRLKLSLRDEVLEGLKKIHSKEDSEKTALALIDRPLQELFQIEE